MSKRFDEAEAPQPVSELPPFVDFDKLPGAEKQALSQRVANMRSESLEPTRQEMHRWMPPVQKCRPLPEGRELLANFNMPGGSNKICENQGASERANHAECQLVRRLQRRFPAMAVDLEKGNAVMQQRLDELIAMGAPEAILKSHRGYFGNTIYVVISDPH